MLTSDFDAASVMKVPKKRFPWTPEEGEEAKCTLDVLYSKSQGGSRVG